MPVIPNDGDENGNNGSGGGINSGLSDFGFDFSAISLNGDYGSYFDGQHVICTIDKSEFRVAFSLMAQISKSDFGIFYGVVPHSDADKSALHSKHSGAGGRQPLYVLPAVYVTQKSKPAPSGGGENNGGGTGENSGDVIP